MSSSTADVRQRVTESLRERAEGIADRWVRLQLDRSDLGTGIGERELGEEAHALVAALLGGLGTSLPVKEVVVSHAELNRAVTGLSLRRARTGATPTSTLLAVLALKEAVLEAVQHSTQDAGDLFAAALLINELLYAAGALSFATYVEGPEEIIRRQRRQLLEVPTPVIQLWHHILAVPLIGTLDTARVHVVMESLLGAIAEQEARVAIIDITGVPTLDTAVAEHLAHRPRGASHGGGLHHQRHPADDRADHRPPGHRPLRHSHQGHARRRPVRGRADHGRGRAGPAYPGFSVTRRPAAAVPILRLGDVLLTGLLVDLEDSAAAAFSTELAERIEDDSARGVLIDISRLEIIDSFAARTLMEVTAMARLMGARVIVAGMRPAVAVTLVEPGLELTGVETAVHAEQAMAVLGWHSSQQPLKGALYDTAS